MFSGWVHACRRVIIRIGIRRRDAPPHIYRFHADRWHTFRIYAAAAQIQSQQLDSQAMLYTRQPTILVLRSSVEGVTYYKESSGTVYVPRTLRPFEVTDDFVWQQGEVPRINITNPTRRDAKVEVLYGTRATGGGGEEEAAF